MASRMSTTTLPTVPVNASVLVLGGAELDWVDAQWPQSHRLPPITDPVPRYALAVLIDPFGHQALGDARAAIAACRDRWAESVWVITPEDAGAAPELLALGFRREGTFTDNAHAWLAFTYQLHNYKSVPDWLNARFWANPERWKLR